MLGMELSRSLWWELLTGWRRRSYRCAFPGFAGDLFSEYYKSGVRLPAIVSCFRFCMECTDYKHIMCPAAIWQSPLVNECIGISCNHAICVQNPVVRALRPSDRATWGMNALSMDQIRRNLNLASA